MNKNENQFNKREVRTNNGIMNNYSYESSGKLYDIYQDKKGKLTYYVNGFMCSQMPMHKEIINHFNVNN